MRQIDRRGHLVTSVILAIFGVIGVTSGYFSERLVPSVAAVIAICSAYAAIRHYYPGSFLGRAYVGVALQACILLFIWESHQIQGMLVLATFAVTSLIMFEDPLCFVPAAVVIVAQYFIARSVMHLSPMAGPRFLVVLSETLLCALISKILHNRTMQNLEGINKIAATELALKSRLAELNLEIAERRLSERRFELVINSTEDGIYDYDLVQNTFYISARFKEMMGYSDDEMETGTTEWQQYIHPDEVDHVDAEFTKFVNGEVENYFIEHRVRHRDGNYRWWRSRAKAERDPATGIAIRVVGSASDITHQRASENELFQAAQNYKLLFEAVPQPMWVYDVNTLKFLTVNTAAVEHYGYSSEEFLSMTIADIRLPEDVPELMEQVEWLRQNPQSAFGVYRYVKKNGDVIHAEVSSSSTRSYDGRDARLVMATDVTEQLTAQRAVGESERRFRELFENATEGIFQTTFEGSYIRINPALARMYGYDSIEIMIAGIADISKSLYVDPRRRNEFIEQITHGVVKDFESEIYRADGTTIWISENARAVKDNDGNVAYFEGFVENITERKAIEAERERIMDEAIERADTCPLTGLLNHRAFHKRLEQEADRAQRMNETLAIAVLDMDNFKFFNDAYGHAAGDSVLLKVAANLRTCCRSYDVLARFGGDEFAVLMPNVTTEFANSFTERVQKIMEESGFQPDGYDATIPLGISVGLALFPDEAVSRLEALELADNRLRRVKTGATEENLSDCLRQIYAHSHSGFTILDALVTAVDNKDRYTRRHSEDVVTYGLMIAKEMGLDQEFLERVQLAALLHDVGKIGVPDHILRKPGNLSEQEYQAIMQHPTMGAMIVSAVPGFSETLDAIRHHHERWDGKGYPDGLAGVNTPLIARIMSVADAYSAMTTSRPYRKGMDSRHARKILLDGAGVQWDPVCVDAFLQARSLQNDIRD